MSTEFDPSRLHFRTGTGLIPAIVQDAGDGTILMLGYMNREALDRTLASGRVTFYSRSRNRLWEKGETSGHTLALRSITADCDGDALLVHAVPAGPTCHTGSRSCFAGAGDEVGTPGLGVALTRLARIISRRDEARPTGSYTTELLGAGTLRIAKKVAEEGAETALAAVAEPDRIAAESVDLLYHLLVLWQAAGVDTSDIAAELTARGGRHTGGESA